MSHTQSRLSKLKQTWRCATGTSWGLCASFTFVWLLGYIVVEAVGWRATTGLISGTHASFSQPAIGQYNALFLYMLFYFGALLFVPPGIMASLILWYQETKQTKKS